MKKSILYRAIPCLVAFIFCMAVIVPVVPSVSAATSVPINPIDYTDSIVVDGTTRIVTVRLPDTLGHDFRIYDLKGYDVDQNILWDTVYTFDLPVHNYERFYFHFQVFGGGTAAGYSPYVIDISDFPNGTQFSVNFLTSLSYDEVLPVDDFNILIGYNETLNQFMATEIITKISNYSPLDNGLYSYSSIIELDKSLGTYLTLRMDGAFNTPIGAVDTYPLSISFAPLELIFTYDMMLELIEEQGELNETMKAILTQAIETNENLDEIALLLAEISDKLDNMECDHSGIEALLQSIDNRLKEQGSSLDEILGVEQEQLSLLESILAALDTLQNAITSLPEQITEGFKKALAQVEKSLDDLFTGGTAGDNLGEAGDRLEDVGGELGDAMDDMNNIKDQLPTMTPDLDQQISGNLTEFQNADIGSLMPWNDPNYVEFWTALTMPTVSSLSVALLLYFVFGKAKG